MGDLDVLAGIVGSDGHIYKNRYTFCVTNKNKDFINNTVIPLIKRTTNKSPKPKFVSSGFGNGKYKVCVSSVDFCKTMINQYNIPAGAKSSSIKPPNLSSQKRNVDYLRGWIAGDGSVTRDRTRAKIEIWSKSFVMLEWFVRVLNRIDINSRLFRERNKNEYILRIGRKNDLETFYNSIEIPHKEKQNKLESLLSKTSRIFSI